MDFLPYSHEYMLAVAVMGGALLGFIWDIYRLARHYIYLGKIGTAAGDLAYWLVSVWFGMQLILDISLGDIRMFVLAGFLAGAAVYFCGLSKYILKSCIFVVDSIIAAVRKFLSWIVWPIAALKRRIVAFMKPYQAKLQKKREKLKRRYKFFKFRTKTIFKTKKMMYNKKKLMRQKDKRLRKSKRRREHDANGRKSKNNRSSEKNKSR